MSQYAGLLWFSLRLRSHRTFRVRKILRSLPAFEHAVVPQASLWAEMTFNNEGEKEEEAAAAAAAEVEVEEEVEMEAVAVVMATLPWLQIWRQGWIRHRFFFGKGSSRSRNIVRRM